MIFTPAIVKLFTFSSTYGQEPVQVAITLTRIMFPFFIFIGLAAITMAILNSLDYFFVPALAPASFNIVLIISAILAPYFTDNPITKVKILAVGVLLGGFSQFIVMVPLLIKEKFPLKVSYYHERLKDILKMMIPATIGQSVVQLTLIVNTMLGWMVGEGAITALNYGNRLMNFPLGVLGVSISQSSVPTLSRQVAQNDIDGLKNTLNYLVRTAAFVMIPASVGLMVLSKPIIRLLFQHGKFDSVATVKTASCLYFFATGLLFYTLVKVVTPIFYAYMDTKTPVISAAIAMIFNIVMNLILMVPMKEAGLAFSTALTSLVNILILFYMLRKKIGLLGLKKTIIPITKILISAFVMGVVVYGISGIFEPAPTFIIRLTQVLIGIFSGIATYFISAYILGVEEYEYGRKLLSHFGRKILKK
jgi:putative peptidoglycan lipid II flippase